jgi:hypothetical protein
MKYKVTKEFGYAKKGDVFTENEDGLFEFTTEDCCEDFHSTARTVVSADIANNLVASGHLVAITEDDSDDTLVNAADEKLNKVNDFIDEKLLQYAKDHDALLGQYQEGELPLCAKVEADTVYFNLNKLLTKIKELINE